MKYAHIVGWGSYLPEKVVTNNDIAQIVDTSDEWVFQRTGIKERRVAGERETTATLAFEAAARALAVADLHPSQVELIIVATSTPEFIFPSTASQVQDYLGAHRAGAFDLSAACSGFVYALTTAANAIQAGTVKNAVVIGAETMSRVLDWNDRATCILFGDGAGAVVLRGSTNPGGVLSSTLRSDGSGGDLLSLPAVYKNPMPLLNDEYISNGHHKNTISMNGRQVFRFATRVVSASIAEVVDRANLTIEDVDLIVPHQANMRIIESAAKKLKVPSDVFHMNVDVAGNTSAASIPIALCDAVEAGRLKPDDNVVFCGFGGGLTWASCVVKWNVTTPEISLPEREWKRARYIWARTRSQIKRMRRRWVDRISRSPTPNARLKDADKK